MIISKEVDVNVSGRNKQYYLDKGYIIPTRKDKQGRISVPRDTKIRVSVDDLPPNSCIQVKIQCDCCGKISETSYQSALNYSHDGKHYCKKCNRIIFKNTMMDRYGVDNPSRLDTAKKKREETFGNHYGVTNPFCSNEIKEKIKKTNIEKYGVENPFANEEIKEKIKSTMLNKYGYAYAGQVPDIREKINKTMKTNNGQKVSSQQRYLADLYGGELNYVLKYYFLDIFLKDEKIDIEVDFGGHDLGVKIGNITQEEFDRKEMLRDLYIRSNNIKIIRLISPNNKLPSDKVLLDILSFSKQYFSNSQHTWINFYLNENKYRNAEYMDENGCYYDFGELCDTRKLINLYKQKEVNDVA